MQQVGIISCSGIGRDPAYKHPFQEHVKANSYEHDVSGLSLKFVASLFTRDMQGFARAAHHASQRWVLHVLRSPDAPPGEEYNRGDQALSVGRNNLVRREHEGGDMSLTDCPVGSSRLSRRPACVRSSHPKRRGPSPRTISVWPATRGSVRTQGFPGTEAS